MKLTSTNVSIVAYNGTGKALIRVGGQRLFIDENMLEELQHLIEDMEQFNRGVLNK